MGIAGLLPLLKAATKNCHVRKLSGSTVAIDAYGWLHKGAFGCAEKLGKGEPTTAYITYCMKYIQVLLDNNVKPILVLDGRNLPSKEHTEKKRREKRKENRELARKYLQEGKRKEAWECFTKCVDITPEMAREFIKVLREKKIDYVVAPYEADAQLAYLAKTGVADVIITEDSDLVLFDCPKIFFKMSVSGDGVLYDRTKLPKCFGATPKSFRFEYFRWMCILSGCDYLASIPGIGLGRAKKVIQAADHESIEDMIMSIPKVLDKVQVEITEDYINGFIQAENTFLYQLVFDTISRKLLPLNPYPEGLGPKQLPYAGSYEYEKIACEIALGNVDLHSLKTVDRFDPLRSGCYTSSSIWSPSYNPGKAFTLKTEEAASVGMELSVIKKSSPKKKRPLQQAIAASKENEDNISGDDELMNLYGKPSATSVRKSSRRNGQMSPLVKEEKEEPKDDIDVSISNKRRRLTSTTEERSTIPSEPSPASNTRSQSRNVPFRKSADKSNIVVKSKYFRSEQVVSSSIKTEKVKTESNIEELFQETENSDSEDNDDDDNEDFVVSSGNSETKLSIYSCDISLSSQDSAACSELSAASQLIFEESQGSQVSVTCKTETTETDSKFKSEETEVITLDDEDETYGSMETSKTFSFPTKVSVRTRSATLSQNNTASSQSSPYFSRPNSASPPSSARAVTTRSSARTTGTPCRRVGLSKNGNGSTKKDPKQPSVKDMFMKRIKD